MWRSRLTAPRPELGDRMRNRAEIVDDPVLGDSQPLLHQVRPDDPWIVGQLQDFTPDRPGKRDRQLVGKVDPGAAAKFLPGKLEAGMVGGPERHRLAQFDDLATIDRGNGEPGVGAEGEVPDGDDGQHGRRGPGPSQPTRWTSSAITNTMSRTTINAVAPVT